MSTALRVSVVLSDAHHLGVDPAQALEADRQLVGQLLNRVDGITLTRGWATSYWNLQALTAAAYLSAMAHPLGATVRALPLGALNPIELAEQIATVDQAWEGNFSASISIGSKSDFEVHGIDPALGAARFEEGLSLVRDMWTAPSLVGAGPQFVFGPVQPTLRPVRPGGPPLQLDTSDEAGIALAIRLGLGVHLGPANQPDLLSLVRSYRTGDGNGEVSLDLEPAQASDEWLRAAIATGVDQFDVRIRRPGTPLEIVIRTIDLLRDRLEVSRGQ